MTTKGLNFSLNTKSLAQQSTSRLKIDSSQLLNTKKSTKNSRISLNSNKIIGHKNSLKDYTNPFSRPKTPLQNANLQASVPSLPISKIFPSDYYNQNSEIKGVLIPKNFEIDSFMSRNSTFTYTSKNKNYFSHSRTSRPSSGSKKNRKANKIDFLPDKGNQFASEVLVIWKNMEINKNKNDHQFVGKQEESNKTNFCEPKNCVEEEPKSQITTKKSIVLEIPKMKFENTNKVGQDIANNNFHAEPNKILKESLGVYVQPKIISVKLAPKSSLQMHYVSSKQLKNY